MKSIFKTFYDIYDNYSNIIDNYYNKIIEYMRYNISDIDKIPTILYYLNNNPEIYDIGKIIDKINIKNNLNHNTTNFRLVDIGKIVDKINIDNYSENNIDFNINNTKLIDTKNNTSENNLDFNTTDTKNNTSELIDTELIDVECFNFENESFIDINDPETNINSNIDNVKQIINEIKQSQQEEFKEIINNSIIPIKNSIQNIEVSEQKYNNLYCKIETIQNSFSIYNNYINTLNSTISSNFENINEKLKIIDTYKNMFEQQKTLINTSVDNITKTSKKLGEIGETNVMQLFSSVNKKYDIKLISGTGHCGDISVYDSTRNITYMIEVKNKQNIDKNDIDKFISDINNTDNKLTTYFGLFISLNTNTIPYKGDFCIENNTIYLSKNYINIENLKIICNNLIPLILNKEKTKNTIIKYEYDIDKDKLDLILNVKQQYYDSMNIVKIIDEEIDKNLSSKNNLEKIKKLMFDYMLKLEDINNTLKLDSKEVDNVRNEVLERFKNYMKNTPKKKITKTYLLEEFSLIKDIIQESTIKELRLKYC